MFKNCQGQELRGNFDIYHMLSWLDEFVLSRNHPKHFMNMDPQMKGENSANDGLEEFPTMHSRILENPQLMQDMISGHEKMKIIDSYPAEDVTYLDRPTVVDLAGESKKRKLASAGNCLRLVEHKLKPHVPKDKQDHSMEMKPLFKTKPCTSTPHASNNENDLFGALIASQLKTLSDHHRLQARHEINNVMFQIQMQQLNSSPQFVPQVSHMNQSTYVEEGNEGCPCNQEMHFSSASSCYSANAHCVKVIDDQTHSSAKDRPLSSSSGSPAPVCIEYRQGYAFKRQKDTL